MKNVFVITMSLLVRSPTMRRGAPLKAGWRTRFPPNRKRVATLWASR